MQNMAQINLSEMQKQNYGHGEQRDGRQGREGRRVGTGMGGVGAGRCKLLYVEWMNEVLLYSTLNYVQYPTRNHSVKDYKSVNAYLRIIESFAVPQ